MKVLCCGSRDWKSWPPIWKALRGLGPTTVIVHGDAHGADKMCAYVANKLGYSVLGVPANWDEFGKSAGPMRNQQMLDEHEDIGLVLAFCDDLKASRGTNDMVTRARAENIPVNVIRSEE